MRRPVIGQEVVGTMVASAPAETEEQLELIIPPTNSTPDDGTTRHADLVEAVKRDRAGRPPGARNLMTRDVVAFVRRMFGDPLIESARWAMHTPASLARELGCSRLEAFHALEKIRADLRTFMYPRCAPTDGQGNVVAPVLNLMIGGAAAPIDGSAAPPWDYLDQPATEPEKN